tara:strand:- start:659 stop:886 length:228 start_codon:yes stop_codon:yes gene_type:complete
MAELHETLLGRRLLDNDIPKIAKALEKIANILEENIKQDNAKKFLNKIRDCEIDISDGEALDTVYEILLTNKTPE